MSDYTPIQEFYYEKLKWCGCGNPEDALQFMRIVLGTMHRRSDVNRRRSQDSIPYDKSAWKHYSDRLRKLTPGVLGLSYMYMLDAQGLTEHGSSVYGSWLSPEGVKVLDLLRGGINLDDQYD